MSQRANRFFKSAFNDIDADLLIIVFRSNGFQRGEAAYQCHTAAWDNAFFDSRARCVQSILDAGFLFLHLSFGSRADVDDGHAPGELSQAFLKFFAVVIGGGFLNLAAQLIDAALDGSRLAASRYNSRAFLIYYDRLGRAKVLKTDGFELEAEIFGDALARR